MIDIHFVVLPGTLLLDLAGPAEAFRLANQQRTRRGLPAAYRLLYTGPRPDATTSVGLCLLAGRQHLRPAVHRVQDAVCAQPASDWSLAAMAGVAHVTPRHLGRLFTAHAGVSPRSYVAAVRVALAEQAIGAGQGRKQALAAAGVGGDRQWRRLRAGARAGVAAAR